MKLQRLTRSELRVHFTRLVVGKPPQAQITLDFWLMPERKIARATWSGQQYTVLNLSGHLNNAREQHYLGRLDSSTGVVTLPS